ncbi:unnamed protein product [Durusdinium trenchii]|uniref:Uncharacterized protein n=2 Tax=Durusdinium trenchii TaxID=1381693 RepID=A0ABP0RRH3_9DINO
MLALCNEASPREPETLPEFAYRMLSTTGALSEKRAAWPVYHNLLRERENPFIFGRRSFLRTMQLTGPRRRKTDGLTLMQGIWDEWKATHPPCGGAHTLAPRNALEGLQSFGEEALAAVARLVHQRPSTLKEKGFMEAAKKEWDQMSVPHQLLWATKSVARAKSSPPKSTPRPKKRKRSSTPGQQMPLLPPGFHKRSTPSSDIYGQGSEAAFSHPLVQSLLEHARKRVSLGLDWVLCVRSYARSGLDPESGKTQKGGIMSLTLKMLEELGLLSDPESRRRLHIFVAHDDPHFTKGCYEKLLGDLGDRLVVGVRGADLQVRFIEECFPIGQHVVVCDDNIVSLQRVAGERRISGSKKLPPLEVEPLDLSKQILHAAKEMNQTNAHLWGISPTNNTMFLQNAHELKSSLGLIFGAFFGFIVLHEPKLYTQHGQVKDDLERTLRYWDRDHIVLRFSRVFCKKNFKPGAFYKSKGGISASLGGREAHQAEAANALQKLVREFYRYIRLPAPAYDQKKDEKGELKFSDGQPVWKANVSNCGVVFLRDYKRYTTAPKGMACRLSFVCVECRQTPQKNCDRCCQPIPKEVGVLSEAVTRVDARRVTSSVMGRGVERRVDDLLNPVTCDVDIIICSDLLHFAAFISGGVPDVLPNAFRLGDAFWRRTVPLSKQWESQANRREVYAP